MPNLTDLEWILKRLDAILILDFDDKTKIRLITELVTQCKDDIDPDIQFVLSGEGACYCTDSLICSPCGKDTN